ncbi:MAG: FAD-binding oxidoreductase [bacterium]|nr:FAD-binding oxidoreductase [bacterium]MDZ4260511.1 FAD-binding oxidoreductase [Candidatus Sungbacteria bacterium]
MDIRKEIESFFEGDIDDSPATLETYSRDASIFYIKPSLVVFPKNIEDIKKLAAFAAASGKNGRPVSLTARAAGTDMTGGPLTQSVVVEMTRYFNRTKKIEGDTAVVEPGVYYRDFEKETLKAGMILPSYPASREICTVGGMVANNSGGEKTLRFGKTENFVKELKMVLQDGNEYTFKKLTKAELQEKIALNTFEGSVYKNLSSLIFQNESALRVAKPDVTKNSSGYFLWNVYDPTDDTFDITRVITGSQGTFGIITEITFKLVKPEPASRMLVMFLPDTKRLADLTEQVLTFHPETFESYDDQTFKLAIRFFPEILARMKGNIFRMGLHFLPEAWMLMTGGIPKLVLLVEFTGKDNADAESKANVAYDQIRKNFDYKMRVTRSDEEGKELQVIRRESFSLLRKHVRGLRTAPFIDDFAIQAKHLPEFLEKLYKILNNYRLIYTVAGHVGDGNFHIIPLMDLSKPDAKDIIVKLSREVYDLVLSYKGTITAEHNDGIIRGPFLEQQFGKEVYGFFLETKKIFDPENIFNPGKKINVTLDYAVSHIDTKMS